MSDVIAAAAPAEGAPPGSIRRGDPSPDRRGGARGVRRERLFHREHGLRRQNGGRFEENALSSLPDQSGAVQGVHRRSDRQLHPRPRRGARRQAAAGSRLGAHLDRIWTSGALAGHHPRSRSSSLRRAAGSPSWPPTSIAARWVATQRVFVRCLERLCREGAIEIDDLDEAAGMLRGMMVFEPQRGAMFCQKALPAIDEIENRATRCARLFLGRLSQRQEPGGGFVPTLC